MGCCDQRRQAAALPAGDAAPRVGATSRADASADRKARVRYVGRGPVAVRGAVTARSYRFDDAHAIQLIDLRDLPSIVRTGLFHRV